MVTKADFTTEEWTQILLAPQMASLYVALASPSGPVGVVKEVLAVNKQLVDAIRTATGNALIDAVAADFQEKAKKREKLQAPRISRDPKEAKAQCLQACRDVVALVAQKAPAEAEGFSRWLYLAAQRSAEAAKEGGFLGIGGKTVNEAEVAALKDLANVLNITV